MQAVTKRSISDSEVLTTRTYAIFKEHLTSRKKLKRCAKDLEGYRARNLKVYAGKWNDARLARYSKSKVLPHAGFVRYGEILKSCSTPHELLAWLLEYDSQHPLLIEWPIEGDEAAPQTQEGPSGQSTRQSGAELKLDDKQRPPQVKQGKRDQMPATHGDIKRTNRGGRPRNDDEREMIRKKRESGKPWKQVTAEMNEETRNTRTPRAYQYLLRTGSFIA